MSEFKIITIQCQNTSPLAFASQSLDGGTSIAAKLLKTFAPDSDTVTSCVLVGTLYFLCLRSQLCLPLCVIVLWVIAGAYLVDKNSVVVQWIEHYRIMGWLSE